MRSVARSFRRRPSVSLRLAKTLTGYLLAGGWVVILTLVLLPRAGRAFYPLAAGSFLTILLLLQRARLAWRDLHRRQWLRDKARGHARRSEANRLLIGGLVHDFNNILAVILGNISVTRSELEGRGDEWLEPAERATLRGRDLARQLLAFSKTGRPVRQRVIKRTRVTKVRQWDIDQLRLAPLPPSQWAD